MLNVAYIFPGQGAQYVGMGKDFYHQFTQAREVFEQANMVLGFDLTELLFKGPLDELTKTENCQVAIFTVSVACLRALEVSQSAIRVKYTAGLSLGEYTALVAADALNFKEALKLVKIRAQYMEKACQQNPGGMLALIGLSLNEVEKICAQAEVEIANLNSPGQVVISGKFTNLEKAQHLAQNQGARRIIPLHVAGAFHSSLMTEASTKLAHALETIEIKTPKIPVVSNVTARPESSVREIKSNLARQVAFRTLWEDSVSFIKAQGITNFLEIGPGKVLKGLLRKINPDLEVDNIGTVQQLDQFKKEKILCC
jgi:[acyl-carrier-protein] S-malonyltransferase